MSSTSSNEKPPEPGSKGASVNNTTPQHSAYFLSNAPDWKTNNEAWPGFVERSFIAATTLLPRFARDVATTPMRCAACGTTQLWREGELLPVPVLPDVPELLPAVLMAVCAPCVSALGISGLDAVGIATARTFKKKGTPT